jgi:hypothetical protein
VEQVVRGGLIGDHVELDLVTDQAGHNFGRVADQANRRRTARVVQRGERVPVVVGQQVDPPRVEAPTGPPGIDLDGQHAPAVQGDAQALRATHPPEPRGQDTLAGQRAAEVRPGDRAERLVGEAEDALGADVEPASGGHLSVHGQPGRLERPEVLGRRPGRHQHRARDQYARRVRMGGQHRHRLARLDDQRLGAIEVAQRGDDRLEALPVARGPARPAVHDQVVGALGHPRIEVVQQAAERTLLLPAPAAQP